MRNKFPRLNLSGQKFGRLTAVKDVGSLQSHRVWQCACDCGTVITVITSHLRNGNTQSCGCIRAERAIAQGKLNSKHGLEGTGVYRSWIGLIHRCYDKKDAGYKNYGGRGIRVCEFLRASPLNLKSVVGDRLPTLSINRINNDLHYSCGECSECLSQQWNRNIEWATRVNQNRNTRQCVYITINSITRCAAEWSEISGIPVGTIIWRRKKGWLPDRLLSIGQCKPLK